MFYLAAFTRPFDPDCAYRDGRNILEVLSNEDQSALLACGQPRPLMVPHPRIESTVQLSTALEGRLTCPIEQVSLVCRRILRK